MPGIPDYEQMLKIMEMFSAMQKMSEPPKEHPHVQPGAFNGPYPPLDTGELEACLNTPELLTIRASIPFFEKKYQKNLNILVKFIELQRMMEFYREASGYRDGWREHMLASVRPYLDERKQLQTDLIIKIIEVEGILAKLKSMEAMP